MDEGKVGKDSDHAGVEVLPRNNLARGGGAVREKVKVLDINKFIEKLKENKIYFKKNENKSISEIYINKKNIENEIKSLRVSQKVSLIAAVPEIRKEMVKLQRNIDRTKGVVMDGRDIGSVVFPDADIKLFLTASPDIRAKRRHN